jgi:hypothetical protein
MERLRKLINEHKELRIPEFPEDDSFAEWVEELIETDGYYIGLATSLVNKERVSINYEHLEKLKQNLIEFNTLSEEKGIIKQCTKYLKSLEEIIIEIKNV